MTTLADYPGFSLANRMPMSSRHRPDPLSPLLAALDERAGASLREPLRGISSDGTILSGLFPLGAPGAPTAALCDAASSLLAALDDAQRAKLLHPVDSVHWRRWLNVHPAVMRHGLLLDDLGPGPRRAVLDMLKAALGGRGYQQARDVMRLNDLVVALTNRPAEYGEWWYFFTMFGTPSGDRPWGWQIDGHHLNLNCFVLGEQVVFTPSFMGSEPCDGHTCRYAGIRVFDDETDHGLALVRALDDEQAATAVLFPSILNDHAPAERTVPIDGQMVAGAFHDNRAIAYEGLRADAMTDAQRRLLLQLIGTYMGWQDDAHAAVKMTEVQRHLDDTHFCWMGATDDVGPFYYRVQSPVVLIEFDHENGVVFDNAEPTRNHVHTIVRTPNGGDYGADLLRQHYEQHHHAPPTYTS